MSDQHVLAAARRIFREQGHVASTREIARAVQLSEGVIYQRFGSKDALFFAAMTPEAPDVDALLGPDEPPADASGYVRAAAERMTGYFAQVLPLVIRLMSHPAFDLRRLSPAGSPPGIVTLERELTVRLASLERRKLIAAGSAAVSARLLTSLAHDWALRGCLGDSVRPRRELVQVIDALWHGLAPGGAAKRTAARRAPARRSAAE